MTDVRLVMNVVDASATDVMTQVRGQELKGVLVPFYPASNAFPALVDVVITAANGPGSIGVLRFWGHGALDPDGAGFATIRHDGGARLDLSRMLDPAVQAAMARLKPYFAPGARVEFKHCRVATPAGYEWLSNLAAQWGVEIHASPNLQQLCSWSGAVYSFKGGARPQPVRGIDP